MYKLISSSSKFVLIIVLIIIYSLLISCSSNKKIAALPSLVKWERAENFYQRGKYNKAIIYYQQLIFERNSIFTAEAQFKLGECYLNTKKYVDAIFEYQELLRLFPDSAFAADAQFKIGLAYEKLSLRPDLTQDETTKAIEHYTRFTERFPTDERRSQAYQSINSMNKKLIEKNYQNGYIYYKMKDFPASQLYLNEIIALGNRDELEKKSLYYTTLIHIERQEADEAKVAMMRLEDRFPNTKEIKKLHQRYKRMNSKFWRLVYSY